jgi:trehalose 6-phosphate synthase/phosphatase
VEVREAAAHKGTTALRWTVDHPGSVIVAAGDDETDEDLFAALPASAWTLRVGPGGSRARYNLRGVEDLRVLLAQLAGTKGAGP